MVGEFRAAGQATLPATICGAPHLNPIERLWGAMHKWVAHNRYYATFNQFTEAISGFFRKTLPQKWREFTDTDTDTVNFRIFSLKKYKVV